MISKAIDKISQLLKSSHDNTITKQDVLQHLGIVISRIKNFTETYDDQKEVFSKLGPVLNDNRLDKEKKYVQLYFNYIKSLTPQGYKLEQTHSFGTLVETLKSINSVAIELKSNIDKYIGEAEVNKFNMKISHVGVLNFVKICEYMCNYSYFLFNGVVKEISKTYNVKISSKLLPAYRTMYIEKNTKLIAYVVNKQIKNNVFKDVLTSLTELKKEGKDILINSTTDDSSNGELADIVIQTNPLVLVDILGFDSIPLLIGKIYHDILHWWYVRVQREKEWMETRVNLVRLEMNNVDVESEEYLHLSKIADNYDLLITEADSKLNKYFIE